MFQIENGLPVLSYAVTFLACAAMALRANVAPPFNTTQNHLDLMSHREETCTYAYMHAAFDGAATSSGIFSEHDMCQATKSGVLDQQNSCKLVMGTTGTLQPLIRQFSLVQCLHSHVIVNIGLGVVHILHEMI